MLSQIRIAGINSFDVKYLLVSTLNFHVVDLSLVCGFSFFQVPLYIHRSLQLRDQDKCCLRFKHVSLKLEPWTSTEAVLTGKASKQISWKERNLLTATYSELLNELINTWLPSLLRVKLLMRSLQPTKARVKLVWTDWGYWSCLHFSSCSLTILILYYTNMLL